MEESKKNNVSFKETLNLPRTDFPIRSNPKIDDVAMVIRWEKENLYEKAFYKNKGNKKFILMDGPPYANGPIHLGHAYNKILKDIVTKSQRMMGNHVPVTPGWDCHGLPIELKVAQANPHCSREELKKECRKYAQEWINLQMSDFKKIGVCMDWEKPYSTMSFDYEANTLRAFGKMVESGYIERKNKTVPWCYSCKTVLANAEIEYQERKDPSLYVLFQLTEKAKNFLVGSESDNVFIAIWTTTPWTLPLNRAVVLKPNTLYEMIEVRGIKIIVAQVLAQKLSDTLGVEYLTKKTFSTAEIKSGSLFAIHPLIRDFTVPIILDNSVLLEDGTACVHNAPGAGPEDYEIGLKNNLEIFSPIENDGTISTEIQIPELIGKSIEDAQVWVIKKLSETGNLLHKTSIRHSYPHCWRCHKGLIFRATKQWFCNLLHNGLKEKALSSIDSIKMLPEASHNRFKSTIEGRLEWCLSRQRIWGCPIPALLCLHCDSAFISKEQIDRVAEEVEKNGIEIWEKMTIESISPTKSICKQCGKSDFRKEQDILDVWFESGVTHFAVLEHNKELAFPADIYLEGKDQHRAYFQSSLLTSMAINNASCMKSIVTHGFTVDQAGRKMSKSIGNVISPQQIVDEIGTDCLRLWAASIDCSGEAVVSEILLKNIQEVFRKIRNTCRFLLSNLYDFDIHKDAVDASDLKTIDSFALQQLCVFNKQIIEKYKEYNFTAIFHDLGNYCSVDLSSFYLDIIKDRLYVEKDNGLERRSAQTVCWHILNTLTKLMAPILSFSAEQVSDCYQKDKMVSIHLQNFSDLDHFDAFFLNKDFVDKNTWKLLKEIRTALLKAIEEKRSLQIIKHSLEAFVTMNYTGLPLVKKNALELFFKELFSRNESPIQFFKEFLIISQFCIKESSEGVSSTELEGILASVERAVGIKCPRCWQWQENSSIDGLCQRCTKIV